ncbi:MAG: alginate export family protein [Moraxellaceae bacterium]|nr:alginate export family protein [Moraxellaceae bacterium]MDZ4386231.1 alginate export family protein [Moraxellaceae bacterium]
MKRLALAVLPLCGLMLPTSSVYADDLAAALVGGKTTLNLRLRHEQVDDDAMAKTADATTLRARLSYASLQWHGFELGLEMDHVAHLFSERFNDTRNGKTNFPVVPDPDGSDLNQAFITYKVAKSAFTAGRQRVNINNQRFVGGVGWRQNEQTYDALRFSSKDLDKVSFDYVYVDKTHRIFGPEKGMPPADLRSDHHITAVSWQPSSALTLGAYAYLLEFADAAALSSRTLGGYATGSFQVAPVKLDYRIEAARQADYGNNPADFSVNYHHLVLGASAAGVRLAVAEEKLGADQGAGVAMQTPLATMHAFQGWADKFLNTPASGVRDRYVSVNSAVKGTALAAIWHQYDAAVGSAKLGSELNLQASRQFLNRYTLTAKYANYQADSFARDTQKIWLMAEASF